MCLRLSRADACLIGTPGCSGFAGPGTVIHTSAGALPSTLIPVPRIENLPSLLLFFSGWLLQVEQLNKVSYCRGLVVFLALLLAGAANLMCVSCDPDHNEQTPPLRVDFSFIVRGHSGVHAQRFVPISPASFLPSSEDLISSYQRPGKQSSGQIPSVSYSQVSPPLLC